MLIDLQFTYHDGMVRVYSSAANISKIVCPGVLLTRNSAKVREQIGAVEFDEECAGRQADALKSYYSWRLTDPFACSSFEGELAALIVLHYCMAAHMALRERGVLWRRFLKIDRFSVTISIDRYPELAARERIRFEKTLKAMGDWGNAFSINGHSRLYRDTPRQWLMSNLELVPMLFFLVALLIASRVRGLNFAVRSGILLVSLTLILIARWFRDKFGKD